MKRLTMSGKLLTVSEYIRGMGVSDKASLYKMVITALKIRKNLKKRSRLDKREALQAR